MLSRGMSGGSVCLSCRLRLLSQHSRLLRPVSRTFDRRFASPSSSFEPEPSQEWVAPEQDGSHGKSRKDGHGETPGSQKKTQWKRLERNRKHISGSRVLTEASANLGLDMLGKPAYAIVMKDGGIRPKHNQPDSAKTLQIGPDHEVADIETMLESQAGTPTAEEVYAYIDTLRPQSDTVLPEMEFRRLQGLLVDGFLSRQLVDYYKRNSPKNEDHNTDSDAAHDADRDLAWDAVDPDSELAQEPVAQELDTTVRKRVWVKSISPWVPLKNISPGPMEELDPNLRGYIPTGALPKDRIAIRILRECWGLSIAEFTVGLGETIVKFRNYEFILLMRGTHRFVKTLSNILLDPGEKIEAFRNQKSFRLVTTKTKAEAVLQNLHKTLQGTRQKVFPTVLITTGLIDDATLEEVGRITNTHLRLGAANRRVYVTWIEVQSRKKRGFSELEDMRHVVFRLLLTALRPRYITSELYGTNSQTWSRGRFVTDSTNVEKLAWKDKMSQWARYVLPLTRSDEIITPDVPLKELSLPFEPESTFTPGDALNLNETEELFFPHAAPYHPVKWSKDVRTSTVARFGYLLHPHKPQNSTPAPARSTPVISGGQRVFAPMTPHPQHFAKLGDGSFESIQPMESLAKTTIVFRFWPSPAAVPVKKPRKIGKRDKKGLTYDERKAVRAHEKLIEAAPNERLEEPAAPILELRLAATDTEILGVESLCAIKRIHNTDVLLPSSPVDLRFTQTQYAALRAKDAATLAGWQPILDFVTEARLDLAAGKLEARPNQRFHVPMHLFADWKEDPRNTVDSNNLASIQYTFAGLEVHQSLTLPYEGHRLTYTSIEAGRGGGRRAEVTLEPVPGEGEGNETSQEGFLDSCFKFAMGKQLWSSTAAD